MLIPHDDLPLQQTAESLAYLDTSDRDAYGRYWYNGFAPDGEFYFGIALAMYPNRDVMDCALEHRAQRRLARQLPRLPPMSGGPNPHAGRAVHARDHETHASEPSHHR